MRLMSGMALSGIGLVAVWQGGAWFSGLAAVVAGVMIWELAMMTAPDRGFAAVALALASAALLILVIWAQQPYLTIALLLPGALMAWGPRRDIPVAMLYAGAIMIASYGLVRFRMSHGEVWLVWLVLVVVVTDIAGYFVGRMIGGPKFWPGISPKKTWAGVIAGWLAAALVGAGVMALTDAAPGLPLLSAAIAFASQLGDISESAIKRRAGVKDASALIPGHGGLLDRFDGLLGAALLMVVVAQFVAVPDLRF